MVKVNDTIVCNGQIVLSQLPFSDGQRARVVVTEIGASASKIPLSSVRLLLRGKVQRFDDPTAPMIPDDSWEMPD